MYINWTAIRQTVDVNLQEAKSMTPAIIPAAAAMYLVADSFSVKLLAAGLFISSFGYQATRLCLRSLSYYRIKMNLQAWCNERKGTNEYAMRIEAAKRIKACFLSGQERLDLAHLDLTTLPPEIGNLVNLQTLQLTNNRFTTLPPEIGNLVNLQHLWLDFNRLPALPSTIGNLVNLEFLRLEHNQLTALPSTIGNLARLRFLSLERNRLAEYPSQLRNLVYLRECRLYDNPFLEEAGGAYRFTELVVNTEELSEDPAKVLISLIDHVDRENAFPHIRYNTAAGIDALGADFGGITRDCMTGLCKALGQPGQQSLPMIYNETGAMPKIDESFEKRTVQEQQKCWQALGLIFAQGLQNYRSIRTGHRFCLSVFQMMHALSKQDIDQIPESATSCKDIPPNVYKKLLRALLQTEFSSAFSTSDDIEAFLTEGTIPNCIKDIYENAQEFTEGREIDQIIFALAVITKATTKYLRHGIDWDQIKGNSPNQLRRKIEGSLSKQQVKDAFQWEEVPSPSYAILKTWVQNWIDKATEEQLENFLHAISGRTTLTDSTYLSAHLQGEPSLLPSFQTCSYKMNLPSYPDEDTFNQKLNLSLLHIDDGNRIGLV